MECGSIQAVYLAQFHIARETIMTEIEDYEKRIEKAKKERQRLSQKRAEKLALLRDAQEKMEKLSDRAEEKGFSVDDLDDIIKEKRQQLEEQVEEFESSLTQTEEALQKYND